MDIATVIGTIATVCLVLGYMPQAWHTMKTRKTDDIAVGTFLMMGLGSLFFFINGILTKNWPLFIANVITFICSVIIFGIKMYNDHFKDKKKG